jgi:hypothetical protein
LFLIGAGCLVGAKPLSGEGRVALIVVGGPCSSATSCGSSSLRSATSSASGIPAIETVSDCPSQHRTLAPMCRSRACGPLKITGISGAIVRLMSIGKCHICGADVMAGASFIDTGHTDQTDPGAPRKVRWVPVDEDIHGWSPFVIAHPVCFAREKGVDMLVDLVDQSHRRMRRIYDR